MPLTTHGAPRDYHTKLSQSEREGQIPHAITYMWNLKYDKMNLFTKQKQTHRHREQTCGCQGGWACGWDGVGVWGCQMKVIIYGTDKQHSLLYSTENCIQYPMIKHNGKEY